MIVKKYQSIDRHGKRNTQETLFEGARIVVWEKIDGANASFKREGDTVLAFSRNNQLDEHNTLGGFFEWVQGNIKAEDLKDGVIYFGEYTNPHKINYGENTKKFFLFDVYNEITEKYEPLQIVKYEAERLSLNLAPIFYEGEFQSLEHIMEFVGKSQLAPDGIGEGVVIKNYSYTDRFGNQIFTKIVTKSFQETNGGKVKEFKVSKDPLTSFIEDTVTEARVEKMLHKLVDEGKLKEDYAIEDMGTILKLLGSSVYEDVMKEEADTLAKVIKNRVGRAVPNVVKSVLFKEGRA